MKPSGLIALKRDGRRLPPGALAEFVAGLVSGSVTEYQAAALLMACFIRGLDREETVELTLAIRDSGTVMAWPGPGGPVADKHSTGGVGDKVSLIVAPLAAAAGLRVPMLSGRSLGHTGGTLDKLEAIPGMRTSLEPAEFERLVAETGLAMGGQTAALAPADRILYALRDATATVESVPLICASILGKKLAEGIGTLVLDVKAGRGAFMTSTSEASGLAATLAEVGRRCGLEVGAAVTDMDTVLGRTAGNALETAEALDILEGRSGGAVRDLSVELTAMMVSIARGSTGGIAAARAECAALLSSGAAMERFASMVGAQGGDLEAFRSRRPAPVVREVRSDRCGYWTGVDARVAGEAVRALGAGRYRMDDEVMHDVGWEQAADSGFQVEDGQIVGWVHARSAAEAEEAAGTLEGGFIWDAPNRPLILEVM